MATLTIIRGLPGSGKTTYARELAAQTGAILLEPDALLMVDGKYQYTPERFQEAVYRLECVIECLTNNDLMDEEGKNFIIPEIIYADVLPDAKSIQRIVDQFQIPLRGKDINVVTLKATKKQSMKQNTHAVRECDIDRMIAEWEDVEVDFYGRIKKVEKERKLK